MPGATIIPEVPYPDVLEGAAWLVRALGFRERLRIGRHRVQLSLGEGALVVVEAAGGETPQRVLLRVSDADAACERARQAGASIVTQPADHPFGERQCTVVDPAGHQWTLSQSIADVDPADWGGELVDETG